MDKRKRRLLCMLEGGKKYKWIRGAPPLSFRAFAAGTLENYRIYGNTVGGESVGDLVESGEHAGEYKVPVTVEGKNLLPNTATSQTINGIAVTVNSDKSISLAFDSVSSTRWVSINSNVSVTTGYILNGCPNLGIDGLALRAMSNNSNYYVQDTGTGALIDDTIGEYAHIVIRIPSDYANSNLTFYPMIRKADIEDDTYEPYHAPETTPIYLPEQIKKVGDEAEYISYAEQKMHRIGADDLDVTLPALPTLTGTNVLSVGTEVQPSEIEVKGKIKAL